MSYNGVGFFRIFDGRLNATRYIEILDNQLKQSIAFLYPSGQPKFQQDNASCYCEKIMQKSLKNGSKSTK